jgi:5-methylcytosine-specific restriction endonuclease McrA
VCAVAFDAHPKATADSVDRKRCPEGKAANHGDSFAFGSNQQPGSVTGMRRTKKLKTSGGETNRWRKEMNACIKSRGDRLALLKAWSDVKVIPRGGKSLSERRAAARLCFRPPRNKYGICWSCKDATELVRHHVIQLQNGGTNDHLNTVKICKPCHAEIHPWLEKPNEQAPSSYEREEAVPAMRQTVSAHGS